MKPTFYESQKLSSWILWLTAIIFLPIVIMCLWGWYKQAYLGEPFGDKPGSDLSLIFVACLCFGLMIFLWSIQLKTTIDTTEINIHFFPMIKKAYAWKDISKAEVIDYGFIGGWGVRFTRKYGIVYNTKGKMGLFIVLENGKKRMIGTQKPQELALFLKSQRLI